MNDSARPKRVVLGVTASIAAYKAADLASKLVKSGVEVYPILTAEAARFVGPATFTALTGHPCPIDVFEEPFPGEIAHIWLARNCDLIAIVPASMNCLARLAHGLADDMLTAAVMATAAPVLLAPAMNTGMWNNPATQANLETLSRYGYQFIEPVTGMLACRTEGVGKMADVVTIEAAIQSVLRGAQPLSGKRVLITAGPTREPIDPVRYLTNRSSGKMGYALAEAARRLGAAVTLISGPTALPQPVGVDTISVETASEMKNAVAAHVQTASIIIAAAAVADYRPETVAPQKIKKSASAPTIVLVENEDILAWIGRSKRADQILIGFAAESENLLANAEKKLRGKNLDWIVANDVTAEGAGFDVDTNIATMISRDGQQVALPKMSKREMAEKIWEAVGGDTFKSV
ncbi:peptidase ClpP [Capsulimonas corticalis]|uniref:Coenzyme A biosynthesis bifunctional protein CoaBC n=1 Tax=Capsulimonas corticalis TaxID=2219043 RepID=A0A402D4T7_9BACT|nr:bifunctional phosphopantothenoylcysteine decarboxylase/phosphopantothenate--cysteine ligase CoaBC [Capsulimonas corticalis]BDI31954.1 peptidase ClpP [Capsulimonas corticalis]